MRDEQYLGFWSREAQRQKNADENEKVQAEGVKQVGPGVFVGGVWSQAAVLGNEISIFIEYKYSLKVSVCLVSQILNNSGTLGFVRSVFG